jgi:hypothetical protein
MADRPDNKYARTQCCSACENVGQASAALLLHPSCGGSGGMAARSHSQGSCEVALVEQQVCVDRIIEQAMTSQVATSGEEASSRSARSRSLTATLAFRRSCQQPTETSCKPQS